MKLNDSSKKAIREAIRKAVAHFKVESETEAVTDIYLRPCQGSADLTLYDDDDRELARERVEEWGTLETDNFENDLQPVFISILNDLKQQGTFDQLCIMKPYSFVLVDEHKEIIADLLLMDDDTLLVNDELLKGLDDELNAFLKDLLEI